MSKINDEWFTITKEDTYTKQIEALTIIVHQQAGQIALLSDEIKQIKKEIYSTPFCQHVASQNDRTHELLEELTILKQRELNIMLREKIPVPFTSFTSLSTVPGLYAKFIKPK